MEIAEDLKIAYISMWKLMQSTLCNLTAMEFTWHAPIKHRKLYVNVLFYITIVKTISMVKATDIAGRILSACI